MTTYSDNVRGGALDEHAATELKLYIDNTAELMGPRSQGESIRQNLLRKIKKGTFDLEKSVKLWMYLTESGAKMYAKEFGEPDQWHEIFSVPTRRAVARELAEEFHAQAQAGEFPEPGRLLGRLESNARGRKPKPSSGYAYEAEALDAPSEDWDTVVYTPTGREAFVGMRTIDGEMMNVWQVPAGVRPGRPYSHHIAQLPQMSRNAHSDSTEPGDYIVTELEHPGWWSFFIIDSRGFPKEIGPNMMRSFDDALEVVRLHAREEDQEHAVIFHEKALHDLRQVGNYVRGRGIQFGGGVPYSPNASDAPPPPRRRRVADPSLRRVRQIVEREERPFEPERRYPRETKPHHFVVNAGLEQWREPDDASQYSAVWYGPGGRDEAEQATEIDEAGAGWHVREYQHLAGYVDDFDPDEPFLVTETFVDQDETLQALNEAGISEPDDPVELMRYAVAFGVAALAERGGDESYASELP